MSKNIDMPLKIINLIKAFKASLKKFFGNYQRKRSFKFNDSIHYYEEAKIAETEQRDLFKALDLYIKAIQNGQKKDSSIKDFASSLHQLGYTKQAVRLMDDCEEYYDGNKDKYFRLRDNLELQINPTGKHLCRYILIENINQEIKSLKTQEEVKNCLFKSPKRIKRLQFFEDFELLNIEINCSKQNANNILVEFQSFSAAKKTLESFYFEEWFGSNLYWVNYRTMRIICTASDGKKDFQEGFIINDDIIEYYLKKERQNFWTSFGEQIYESRNSNGFINLLSTHLIKEHGSGLYEQKDNKENIFESSKIVEKIHHNYHYLESSLQSSNKNHRMSYEQSNERQLRKYSNYSWY